MNKAEIAEIKKLFNIRNCNITRICGCYVDLEKSIKARWAQSFLSMDEEEILKYLDLLSKNLSGGRGKNLRNLEFDKMYPTSVEWHKLLDELRDSKLQNMDSIEKLYESIIEEYDYENQYTILVVYGVYDILGKTKDGIEMEDASDEIYEYIMICMCPVVSQKPGLIYDSNNHYFTHLETGKMLGAPDVGILYPAFNERSTDTDACLGYTRTMDEVERYILEAITGNSIPMSAGDEKKAYNEMLEQALGTEATMDKVRRIEEKMQELKEEHAFDEDPYKLKLDDLVKLFREASIDEHRIGELKKAYGEHVGVDESLTLDNLGHMRAFTVSTDIGKVQMVPDRANELSIRELDGKKVLVIPLEGDVEVNGIPVGV